MVKILAAVANFLFVAVAQPDVVGLLQHQTDLAATLAMRRDDLGYNTSNANPGKMAGAELEACKADPKSCVDKVKCPVVAALINDGLVKNPTDANQEDLMQAVQAGAGTSKEAAFLTTIDAMYLGNLNLFDLPSNHISNTGIRSKGFVNETAFDFMWDKFHAVKYPEGIEVMCIEDMKKAAEYYRKIESEKDPTLDFRAVANWQNTVYGEPEGRDIIALTMLALPLLFGKEYGDTKCSTKAEIRGIYVDSKLPEGNFESVGVSRFVKAAQLAGKVANAKWHAPFMRTEYWRRQGTGEIPRDAYFSNQAILVMYLA